MIPTVESDLVVDAGKADVAPVISVITPVYNPTTDLLATARSLKDQTSRDFEWILVNDASDRGGADLINQAAEILDRPVSVLRHRNNFGQGQARNTGMGYARGRYIKFLDSDDALDPAHLEKLFEAACRTDGKRKVVFAATRHLFLMGRHSVDNISYRSVDCDRNAQLVRILTNPFLCHCGALFPRNLLDDLGGYDTDLVTDEDGDLLMRVLLADWLFVPVPGVFYIYRHHGDAGRVSRDDTPEKIVARRQVGDRIRAHFEATEKKIPEEIKLALCRRLDALAVRHWRTQRGEARDLLAAARALDDDYPWSGSSMERAVRRVAGIGTAQLLMSALRNFRGASFQ